MSTRLRGRSNNNTNSDNREEDVVLLRPPQITPSKPEPALDAMPLSSDDYEESEDDEEKSPPAVGNDVPAVFSSSQRSSNRRSRSSDDLDDLTILSDNTQASPKRARKEMGTRPSLPPPRQHLTPALLPPPQAQPRPQSIHREVFSSDPRHDQTFGMVTKKSRQAYGSRYTSQPPKIKSTVTEPSSSKKFAPTKPQVKQSRPVSGAAGKVKEEPKPEPDRTLASTKIREIVNSSFATHAPSPFDVNNSDILSVSSLSSLDSKKTPSLSSDEFEEVCLKEAKCPVCQQPLHPSLHDETQAVQRLPMRRQFEFCKKHTEVGASTLWKERGYPKIKWKKLKKRIAQYLPRLEGVITGETPSFFRDLVRKEAGLQQNKSTTKKFRLTVDSDGLLNAMSTGYYGSRGSKLM